jgi:hypothetical protein
MEKTLPIILDRCWSTELRGTGMHVASVKISQPTSNTMAISNLLQNILEVTKGVYVFFFCAHKIYDQYTGVSSRCHCLVVIGLGFGLLAVSSYILVISSIAIYLGRCRVIPSIKQCHLRKTMNDVDRN